MQNPRLASRYAKSLLDLTVEQNSLEATLKDMQRLHQICLVSKDFELMLRSPIIKGDKKLSVINAVLANQDISAITKGFISLLVSKGRESNLPEIAEAFIAQYNKMKNIRTVKLVTAAPVSDKIKENIKSKVKAFMPNDTMNLEASVDPSLIGGFVLEVEGILFDASVKKSLNEVRSKLIDHSYETKM